MGDSEDVMRVVEALFEAGVTKDASALPGLHLDDPRFSSFGDLPPYDLKDYKSTLLLEELRYASISDYTYDITDSKVSVFGDVAVAALRVVQKGMLVDNKAFTGKHVTMGGRATFVLVRQDGWRIAHIHISRDP